MAITQGPIGTLPIAWCSISDNKPFKKYKEEKDLLTSMINPEIGPFDIKISNQKQGHYYYGVRIVTGDQGDAGTLGDAYIIIIGDKAKTDKVSIKHYFQLFVKNGTYDDFIIECDRDLGEIQLVTVGNGRGFISNIWASWYVEYTLVKDFKVDREIVFPCYHWIALGDYFTNAASCSILNQVEINKIIVEGRATQVRNRQLTYTWKSYDETGLPSSIDTEKEVLPLDERFDRCKEENFLGNGFKGIFFGLESGVLRIANDMLSKLFGNKIENMDSMENLQGFYEVARLLQKEEKKSDVDDIYNVYVGPIVPYDLSRWTCDVEFGRQILNGVNCVVIKCCIELPLNFSVTQEMVKHSLVRSGDLRTEMEDGYVYISDLSEILDGLPCRKDYYCAAPLCLLYVNAAKKLVPIAIQLKRQPSEDNPIFLPTDSRSDWLLAKMYFSNASAQHHQLSSHYVVCHAAMEAYGVATMRTLPDAHPVYKLLRPSFHYTMAINTQARSRLINDGGLLDFVLSIGGDDIYSGKNELFKRSNQLYSVHWSNIKRNIAERGVEDPDKLPNYFYRDDGVRLWDAIEAYAKSIIDLFYPGDKDVAKDIELKNWTYEVHNKAFPAFHGNPMGRGFPLTITSKNELVEYCTLIMFTGSVQHSAVNFGQFQIYGYVPNSPSNLRQPIPTKKGVHTPDDLLHALPHALSAVLNSAITFSLSQFSPEEVFMGAYPQNWFTEAKAKDCIENFKRSLNEINAKIISRNKDQEIPYVFLLSNRCPVSITI